jgi:hypothetical protein
MGFRPLVQVVTAVVIVVFAIGIWSTGDTVNPAWLRFFSVAVLIATIVLAIWDRWLWRLPVAQALQSVPRDLTGTWRGTLTSFWEDPVTKERPVPKVVFLVIRQTASQTNVVLLTEESSSRSSLASVSDDGAGASLAYMYLNRPDSRVEHRSRMHNGSAFFEVSGRPATRIRGRYWTDRDSRGELDFDQRAHDRAEDFREASKLFAEG